MMYKIIKADESICDEVYNIINTCSIWLSRQNMNHWINSYPKNKIKDMILNKEVFVIYLNDLPVGTITVSNNSHDYYVKNDKQYWKYPTSKNAIYLMGLAVLPEYHNKGIASKLIKYVEERANSKKIKYIRFDSVEYYEELVKFYINRGYKVVGKRIINNIRTNFYEKCL